MKMKKATPAGALLRKDIFRFAPLWILYFALCLPMLIQALQGWYGGGKTHAMILVKTLPNASVGNMLYAGFVALCLFGDLFSAKRCEALHAMPMRREKWFVSHLLNGILYSFLPNILIVLCLIPLLLEWWYIGFIWVLGMTMQYLFFFGLAVLCVFLSGNQVGMVMFYGVLNYAYTAVLWIITTVYQPFLYGIALDLPNINSHEAVFSLSPVIQFGRLGRFFGLEGDWYLIKPPEGICISYAPEVYEKTGFSTSFGYYAICVSVGVAFMALGLLLYRKRKLECAGDLTAFRFLSSVLSVTIPVLLGYATCRASGYMQSVVLRTTPDRRLNLTLFFVVTFLSWFVVEIFRKRTVKIFQSKTFLKFAIFAGSTGLVLGLTLLDPAGVIRYIPNTDEIQEATFVDGHETKYSRVRISGTDEQTIETVRKLHDTILKHPTRFPANSNDYWNFTVQYTLKNGKQIRRTYPVEADREAWNVLRQTFCTPEKLLGYDGQDTWKDSIKRITWAGYDWEALGTWYIEKKYNVSAEQVRDELIQAILADCEAGNLVIYPFSIKGTGKTDTYINIDFAKGLGSKNVYITDAARNCLAWREKYADLFS